MLMHAGVSQPVPYADIYVAYLFTLLMKCKHSARNHSCLVCPKNDILTSKTRSAGMTYEIAVENCLHQYQVFGPHNIRVKLTIRNQDRVHQCVLILKVTLNFI